MKKYFIIALLTAFVGGQLKAQTQATLSSQKEKMEKERFAQKRADERKKAEVLRNEKSLESMRQREEESERLKAENLAFAKSSKLYWEELKSIQRLSPNERLWKLMHRQAEPVAATPKPLNAKKAPKANYYGDYGMYDKTHRLDSVWDKTGYYYYLTTYKYNAQGLPTEETWYEKYYYYDYLTPQSRYTYTYDDNGYMTSLVREYFNGTYWAKEEKEVWSYNDYGYQTGHARMSYNGTNMYGYEKWEREYDDYGRLTLSVDYSWDSSKSEWYARSKYENKYDSRGRLLLEASYYSNYSTKELEGNYKYEYDYDSNGHQTYYAYYGWRDGKWYGYSSYASTYDSKGRETSYSYYQWANDKWVLSEYEEYEFDDLNNTGGFVNYDVDDEGNKYPYVKAEINFTSWGEYSSGTVYYNNEGEWVKTAEYVYEYDDQHRMLESHIYMSDDGWVTKYEREGEENRYDSKNRLILHKVIGVDTNGNSYVSTYEEYAYDKNGYRTLEVKLTRYEDGSVNDYRKREYKYDDAGREIYYVKYTWDYNADDWVPDTRREYSYDENGEETLYVRYDWDKKLNDWKGDSKREVVKTANSRVTTEYSWSSDKWVAEEKVEEQYDEKGQIARIIYYYWSYETNDWYVNSLTEYGYDAQGRRTYTKNKYLSGGELVGSYYSLRAFDDNGRTILEIVYDWDYEKKDWAPNTKYEFAFDSYGRRTKNMYYNYDSQNEKWIFNYGDAYEYDSRGNELMYARYSVHDGEPYISSKTEKKTDSYGRLVSNASYDYNYEGELTYGSETSYVFDSHDVIVKKTNRFISGGEWYDGGSTIYEYDFNVMRSNICYSDESIFKESMMYKIDRIYPEISPDYGIQYYYSNFTWGEEPEYPDENGKITTMYKDGVYTNNGMGLKANYGQPMEDEATFYHPDSDEKDVTLNKCWYGNEYYQSLEFGSQYGGTLTLYVAPRNTYYKDYGTIGIDGEESRTLYTNSDNYYEALTVKISSGYHTINSANIRFFGFKFESAETEKFNPMDPWLKLQEKMNTAENLLNTTGYSGYEKLKEYVDNINKVYPDYSAWENISRKDADNVLYGMERAISEYYSSSSVPFDSELDIIREAIGSSKMSQCDYNVSGSHITSVDIQSMGLTSFPEKLLELPYVTRISASYNSIDDTSIKAKAQAQGITVDLTYQRFDVKISTSMKELRNDLSGVVAQLPSVMRSTSNVTLYFSKDSRYTPSYSNNDFYISKYGSTYSIRSSSSGFHAKKGDVFYISNGYADNSYSYSTCRMEITYDDGDGNFDGAVDVADVQQTANWIVNGYSSNGFCLDAADTYVDEIINVQDIVKTVNIILGQTAEYNSVSDAANSKSLSGHANADASLYVQDGKLMVNTNKMIAALDITLSNGDNVKWEYEAMSAVSRGSRILGYTLGEGAIAEGTTVLATVKPGTYVVGAKLVAEDESMVSLSLNSVPTGIEMRHADNDKEQIFDANGMKVAAKKHGLNIIRKADGTTVKVIR